MPSDYFPRFPHWLKNVFETPAPRAGSARRLAGFVAMLAGTACAMAQAPDVQGGKDHPLVSRFAGSQLVGYQQLEFETGRFYRSSKEDPAKELDRDQPAGVEGQVTRLVYVAPEGKTPLEIHRNFEQALRSAGLKVITAVDGRNAWWGPDEHWRANFAGAAFQPPFAADISPFDRGGGLYLYGTLKRGGGDVAVSVLTAPMASFPKSHYKTPDGTVRSAVAVQIVEPKPMATGQVTVTADAIGNRLKADGRIALYGIYFDTGQAELRRESQAQLEEMAALLSARPQLRVHIVGHTDNVGSFESNVALSQRRAEAVVAALVNTHRIGAHRLNARGVASLSPVASNHDEAGRGLNRRVEMVEQ